jgi:hypothetical protein
MSGLLGSEGPGVGGKLMAYNEKRYASKEKPGFSGTKRPNKRGEWVSIDKGNNKRRRQDRKKMVGIFGGSMGKVYSIFG